MKHYINYADVNFRKAQFYASTSARLLGGFDVCRQYSPADIDGEFKEKHNHILNLQRGGGYWLWKPYFILRSLREINYGDYLFYGDSGVLFTASVSPLIDAMNACGQDIMGFELPLIESQWTKRALFIAMDCDEKKFTDSNQILSCYHLIKKTRFSVAFYEEFLRLSCHENNITDRVNGDVVPSADFIEHRHDQSIYSLLYKKNNLSAFRDPSQFGYFPFDYSGGSGLIDENEFHRGKLYHLSNGRKFRVNEHEHDYGEILFHFRRGNPIKELMLHKLRFWNHRRQIPV